MRLTARGLAAVLMLAVSGGGRSAAGSDGAKAPGGPRVPLHVDMVDAALAASGYGSAAARRRARAEFERYAGPMVDDLARVTPPAVQAELLLKALHRKGGLLARYDPRATTLRDILERRAFNCVSASVVYNLIAHRLSLPVAAQLLPTHARSMLSLEREGRLVTVVVETTSAQGFDPDPEQQASILASVSNVGDGRGRALVSEQGAIVDTNVLIGTIYVNRASIAQEGGRLERAEQLFALGQAHAREPSMQRVLIDQRAALLSQLAADDMTTGQPARYARALRTLTSAVRLAPSNPEIVETLQHNLRAAAERIISLQADAGEVEAVKTTLREVLTLVSHSSVRAGVQAFAMTRLAGLRMKVKDYEGAIRLLDQALAEPLSDDDVALRQTMHTNLASALRAAAVRRAEYGDYSGSRRYLKRVSQLPIDASNQKTMQTDRRRILHLVGNRKIGEQDYAGAAKVYREGLRRFPGDETLRHNLLVALERQALPFVDRGDCAAAAPYIAEIRQVDRSASFPAQAELRCVLNQAQSRLSAGDYAEAVRLIRSADTAEETVRHNLSVALIKWTAALARAGRCGEAKRKAKEARALSNSRPRQVKAALGRCRR